MVLTLLTDVSEDLASSFNPHTHFLYLGGHICGRHPLQAQTDDTLLLL